jgi:hypothetical protein
VLLLEKELRTRRGHMSSNPILMGFLLHNLILLYMVVFCGPLRVFSSFVFSYTEHRFSVEILAGITELKSNEDM